MVIYGAIEGSETDIKVTPQFYVSPEFVNNFYEAREITGPYRLGSAILLSKRQLDILDKKALADEITTRSKILTYIALGLAYSTRLNFSEAVEVYQSAEELIWPDDQGKEVLYLLMGNTYSRNYQAQLQKQEASNNSGSVDHEALLKAKYYYQQAYAIDPHYVRALLGLGAVAFLESQLTAEKTRKPGDLNQNLLNLCVDYYQQALGSDNSPELADISPKGHFGLGRCYLALGFSGQNDRLQQARSEFELVIREYGEGKNPRIKELAGHAHAGLGRIYILAGNCADGVIEYQKGINLLTEYPYWQAAYEKTIDKCNKALTPSP
jgi:tetratricopeptide (TPR) repeat protein